MPPAVRLYEPPPPAPSFDWQCGDLLFFWGRGWLSRTIEIATRGPSHVGIVCQNFEMGNGTAGLLLFESTTLCDLPDAIKGSRFAGVQAHDPEARIAAYDGQVGRMRLATTWELETDESQNLRDLLTEAHGRPYDRGGAVLSGSRLIKWTPCMPYPDLGHAFCSELVAAVLMRVQRLPLGSPSIYNPASLMRAVRRCGTYQPLEVLRAA